MNKQPMLFAGTSHPELAKGLCVELGIPLGRIKLNQFPDGETLVEVQEDVRGRDVYILQSMARDPNHYLFELLIIIDAVKRSSARSITAIVPYLGYCRQDRKDKPGAPITAKLVANVLEVAGITNLITLDLHADQVEGFFEILVDHLHCQRLLGNAARSIIGQEYMVVAPDIGSIKLAERMAKLLAVDLALIQKERLSAFDVRMTLIGDVKNKNTLIVDDLCSTGGTLVAAANICKEQGAKKIMAAVTHGLLVGNAIKNIESSALESILLTDTIPIDSAFPLSAKMQTVSVAPIIAEVIRKNQA